MQGRAEPNQPGWPEIGVGLITYLICIAFLGWWLLTMPDEQAAWRAIIGMAANGVAGGIALLAAVALRIRSFPAFGFRPAGWRWLVAGLLLGLLAFGLSLIIEHVYFSFITEVNTQADFQAAARAGPLWLLALVVTGAVLTPFGEEVLFRGVIASALNRYGPWPGILGSAAIFAVVHGPSVILLNAFMAGILTGLLYYRTRSLWPVLVLHGTYNGTWLLVYSVQ